MFILRCLKIACLLVRGSVDSPSTTSIPGGAAGSPSGLSATEMPAFYESRGWGYWREQAAKKGSRPANVHMSTSCRAWSRCEPEVKTRLGHVQDVSEEPRPEMCCCSKPGVDGSQKAREYGEDRSGRLEFVAVIHPRLHAAECWAVTSCESVSSSALAKMRFGPKS